MKDIRLLVAGLLVLAALVVIGGAATTRASPGATITVDSTANTNARDGVLSLQEAMFLAIGLFLTVGDLDAGEADNVSGTPGAAEADTIIFDTTVFPPGTPATISLGGGGLPFLSTGNDTINASNAGVVIDGGAADQVVLSINSDNNTIKGLHIFNFGSFSGAGFQIFGNSNIIGGTAPGEGNVVSAGTTDLNVRGIIVSSGDFNVIVGNYVGTDETGEVAIGNGRGIWLTGSAGDGPTGNTIGGSGPGEGNVVSGNRFGVNISNQLASGNEVLGNLIGTDPTGTMAVPNQQGVVFQAFSSGNVIGGTNPGEGNVISGNTLTGITFSSGDANTVIGNRIGVDALGLPLSNGAGGSPDQRGGIVFGDGNDNIIGGANPGEGNVIAFNVGDGVLVFGPGSLRNTIRGNSIHSNTELAIDNFFGGNLELAPPVITGVSSVSGTVCPNCIVDIYSDDEDEGRIFEGSTAADGGGNFFFPDRPDGPNVTATATDADGNTSEFSTPVEVPPVIAVDIDIKPGSDPNSIRPGSRGTIPVAILSSPDFDGPSEVDQSSLTFGRTGDEESLAFCTKSAEDVNGDGLLDQVCHFNTQDTGFQCGDTEGILRGQTVDGTPIEGSDSVRIVSCP